ncbi:MAG: GGDEF domain-containing protein [Spirochaetota bacterium]
MYTKILAQLKSIPHPFSIDRVVTLMAPVIRGELSASAVDIYFLPQRAPSLVCWYRESPATDTRTQAKVLDAFKRGTDRNADGMFAYTLHARGKRFGMVAAHLTSASIDVREGFIMLLDYFALLLYSEKLSFLANRDRLTQLYNRGFIFQTLERWTAERVPVSIVMMDVDHFKHYNDKYGHQTGDVVLKKLAAMLKEEFKGALIGRYGGEEFICAFKNGDEKKLAAAMEHIRAVTEAADFSTAEYSLRVTISLGGAVFTPGKGVTFIDTIREADEALYRSKHEGRNRVTVAGARA